jgi:hypothetical protein
LLAIALLACQRDVEVVRAPAEPQVASTPAPTPAPAPAPADALASALPRDIPPFRGGTLAIERSFVRRTYSRGARHVSVTVARHGAGQYDTWLAMIAQYRQADLGLPLADGSGFYDCTPGNAEQCNVLIQLRAGVHVEIRGEGAAMRRDVDAIARGLPLRSLANAPVARRASFRRDVLPVLQANCTTAIGCHGEQPARAVHLDLRPEAAFHSLVSAEAELRDGVRVVPGQPGASFLVDKLLGRLGPDEGRRMPLDPQTRKSRDPSPLGSFVEDTLVPWIEAGAEDD